MSKLMMDLIVDILSRLPVKSLLQFRCVSKPWRSLIDSPKFIKMHLNKSIETKSNLSLIITCRELYALDLDLLDREAVKLDDPLKSPNTTNVFGSCNGLLLVGNDKTGVAVWNPFMRKYHKFLMPFLVPVFSYTSYGFGYDSVGEDYKVFRVVQMYLEEHDFPEISEVRIYSIKLNSWRKIQDFPYCLCIARGCHAVFAVGALHWVVKQRRNPDAPKIIVAFDLGVEEYRLVPEPENVKKGFLLNVEKLDGCLCATYSYSENHLEIWVMKEYGVRESWTKLLTVVPPSILLVFEYMKPLSYSKTGHEILLGCDNERLVWYDLKEKSMEEVRVHGFPIPFTPEVSVQSLLPVDGYGKEERKETKNRKRRDGFLSKGFKLVV